MSQQIIEYIILDYSYGSTLENVVNEHIKNGWQPLGGISQSRDSYTQAMVKYEEKVCSDIADEHDN